jgi:hypothetical protein
MLSRFPSNAFNRAFNRLTPAVLQFINELVVPAAVELGLEDGKRLRVDTTVVQTDVHHPTDSGLLWDTVRVITRPTHGSVFVYLGRSPKTFENHFKQFSAVVHRLH